MSAAARVLSTAGLPMIIGGGVGPVASVAFESIVQANVQLDGTDQSHPRVFHCSCPDLIGDRTAYLLDTSHVNPGAAMGRVVYAQHLACRFLGMERAVAGVPCNTFHAPDIYAAYVAELEALGSAASVQLVHIIDATVAEVCEQSKRGGWANVGVMSTTGTRRQGLYRAPLEAAGLKVLEVPESMQDELHDTIYDEARGIKAGGDTPSAWSVERFARYASLLAQEGAGALVLGCTEIPLVLPGKHFTAAAGDGKAVSLVDPMSCLAREMIRLSNPAKLKDDSGTGAGTAGAAAEAADVVGAALNSVGSGASAHSATSAQEAQSAQEASIERASSGSRMLPMRKSRSMPVMSLQGKVPLWG